MSREVEQVVNELMELPFINDMTHKYRKEASISGFILRKPKYIKHDLTQKESCTFQIYQIDNEGGATKIYSYSIIAYTLDIIEQLKKLDKVCLVALVGTIFYSTKTKCLCIRVGEIKTLMECDIELADEWRKKE